MLLVAAVVVLVTAPRPLRVLATYRCKVIDRRDVNPRKEGKDLARRHEQKVVGLNSGAGNGCLSVLVMFLSIS